MDMLQLSYWIFYKILLNRGCEWLTYTQNIIEIDTMKIGYPNNDYRLTKDPLRLYLNGAHDSILHGAML